MSYRDLRERDSHTQSSAASYKSNRPYNENTARQQEVLKNRNGSYRVENNRRSQTYIGPRNEHAGTGDYRRHGPFIVQSDVPCNRCGDGAHPPWKCLFYDRMCPLCFKLGHSPDHCWSPGPVAGVSFYDGACYFNLETILNLASLDFNTRQEEIKYMFNELTPDQVSVISLAMEMHESDESRQARCFRCRAFHSSQLCWYYDRRCGQCGVIGHAEVVCRFMSLSRNNCQYHYFDTRFSSNQGQIRLPQKEEYPYAPPSDFYNGEVANFSEQLYHPTSVDDTVDATEAAESNCASPYPVDRSSATPDPVVTSSADHDPVDSCGAGSDPVGISWADPDPVNSSCDVKDPVDSSCDVLDPVNSSCNVLGPVDSNCDIPDLVDPSFNVPDPVDSGCVAPNSGNESCAVAAPADPNYGTERSTSSNHTAFDLTNVNTEEIFPSVPTGAVEQRRYQNEKKGGPANSNLVNLNTSSSELAISADFMASEKVKCTIGSTTTSSSILVTSSVLDDNHLSPCAAELCDSEKRSRARGSKASESSGSSSGDTFITAKEFVLSSKHTSGSSSDDAYNTAEDTILSSESSDMEITPKDTLIITNEARSKTNDIDGQKRIDASPRIIRDRNSGSKVKPKVYSSEDARNGLPDQGSPTYQHQLGLVCSTNVTVAVDETGACSPSNRVVSKNPIFSSKKNRKRKFPLTTILPPCYRCLSTKHLPEKCWAQEETCFRCLCKGHIVKACSEPKTPSSRTPTENFSFKMHRVRVIDSVREKQAACRSSSDSDSTLPLSPVLNTPTRDLPSPAATSAMSPSEKILNATPPADRSTGVNTQNWRRNAENASRLTNNTSACSGNNGFKTQQPDEDEEKVPVNGPTSQRKMMAGDVRHKQRRDDQHRNDRSKHQHYSSRSSPKKQNGMHSDLVAAASAAAVAATGSSVRQEPRGTPLASLNRMSDAHPGVPGVNPSWQHEVLVQLPAPQGRPPLPYPPPTAADDMWDQNHVRMPCSPSSLYARDSLPPGYPGTSSRDTVPRWCVIKWALSQPLKSVDDVQRAIVSYNSRYKDKWLLHGLQAVVQQFSEEEEDQFFSRTLPAMCTLALRLPELVTRAPSLLLAHRCKAVTLSQLQIASLLANAFFCTFPRRNARGSDTEYALFPDINFSRLLSADGPTVLEKIKCLLNYFRVVTTSEPVGLVTFARHMVENAPAVVWQQCTSALPRLHCDDGGLIEEATGLLQVDFANRFLGGGVLGHGCVQEEIRFMLCPELLITRLLAEALDKNEAIIVVGVEQYSRGEGYADSFVFAGCHRDTTPRDHFGRRMCQLTAIDAVHFRARPSEQFKEGSVVREINKAYAGFCALEGTAGDLPAVATGNWGCGAFRGNPNLKALLQLAACGYAGRDVAYFTFLDAKLKNRIADMHEFLVKGKVTVGALVQCICQYGALSREVDGSDLYQYLYHNLRDPSRTPSPGDSPRPADQGPQQTGNTSERTSGSSWAAKSREMNGNGFDGTNGKNGAQNKARGKETVANNARMTDFFPRLSEKGQRENNKNGTDSLTGTGNGSIASVPQPSSFPPCPPSQSTGGFWDDRSPVQEAPAKGNGGRGGRHKRNRRRKEGLTHQQIVDVITEPDTTEEENGDVRGKGNSSGAGEEFTSSAAKRYRKNKTKGNRRNAHNVKDSNALNSEVGVNKIATGLSRKIASHDDQRFISSKKSVGCS